MIKIQKNKGLSLLDVIFATGIIVIGLVGILGMLRFIIIAGRLSTDRFLAANLAQEGIEMVRAIRDTNWLAVPPRPWNSGLSNGNWRVQYSQTALLADNSSFLNIDGNGYYSYDGSQATKFKRTITINSNASGCSGASGDCLSVVSTVSWDPGYSVVVEDRLYNWR